MDREPACTSCSDLRFVSSTCGVREREGAFVVLYGTGEALDDAVLPAIERVEECVSFLIIDRRCCVY